MMILVDTSVWISWFRDADAHPDLEGLILNNQACISDIILTELLPYLHVKKQNEIIESLLALKKVPLTTNWNLIVQMQTENLRQGINRVGIPDLMILDQVISGNLVLYSEDKHFRLMQKHTFFSLYPCETPSP